MGDPPAVAPRVALGEAQPLQLDCPHRGVDLQYPARQIGIEDGVGARSVALPRADERHGSADGESPTIGAGTDVNRAPRIQRYLQVVSAILGTATDAGDVAGLTEAAAQADLVGRAAAGQC